MRQEVMKQAAAEPCVLGLALSWWRAEGLRNWPEASGLAVSPTCRPLLQPFTSSSSLMTCSCLYFLSCEGAQP